MANLEHIADLKNPSPMMQQYIETRNLNPGYLLLYRLGDFFELFFEDAVTASRELDLTLTGRDCGDGLRAAMCGVPFQKADQYIGRLVEKGYRVAVCDQTEDPSQAVGLVKREIVRLVTPGTVTDGTLLNDRKNNFLGALCRRQDGIGLAFADISTGYVFATALDGDYASELRAEIAVYTPAELLLDGPEEDFADLCRELRQFYGILFTPEAALFSPEGALPLCRECFGEGAEDLSDPAMLQAVTALLRYIRKTQMCAPSFLRELTVYRGGQYMELDLATRRNLELSETMRNKERKGSLLWVLDATCTAMGARLLRSWLTRPLQNAVAILARQGAVADLYDKLLPREELREDLRGILDLERLSAKVAYGSANARDLRGICQSLAPLAGLKDRLAAFSSPRMQEIYRDFDPLQDLYELLDAALVDDPPLSVREGGMIRDGYNRDVDYLRSIHLDGKGWLEKIEQQEKEATGLKNLRVGYNRVFGYYIELPKSQADAVPDRYIRKQTLTNCERYITQELKEMESTILGAQEKLCALEYDLVVSLREQVSRRMDRIQHTAALIAQADVYAALADVAVRNHYVCPEVDLSDVIDIKEGRHPVVEKFTEGGYFVPNDTHLDTKANRLMLITGPNMAGKSTYMRQVALITLMAQIGSFVPAAEAHIGVVDKIFTRVGASDDLASGQSTFMLEMTEVAYILKNATRRSLVVYDEVGRGTSTYDGMSIARAVAEYTAGKKIGAKTLFATHYHELTDMEGQMEGVVNYNVAAKKRGDTVTFLRKIVRGATDDSYGIDVARLAGVPNEVVQRARKILEQVEAQGAGSVTPPKNAVPAAPQVPDMLTALSDARAEEAADRIREVDINTLTPIEAINLVYELKKIVK